MVRVFNNIIRRNCQDYITFAGGGASGARPAAHAKHDAESLSRRVGYALACPAVERSSPRAASRHDVMAS